MLSDLKATAFDHEKKVVLLTTSFATLSHFENKVDDKICDR